MHIGQLPGHQDGEQTGGGQIGHGGHQVVLPIVIGVPAVDELQALLRDADTRIRRRGVWTLARIDDPRLLETFLELLKDDDWEVRRKAARTLVRWHERRVLEALIGALEDEHESVRRVAARVLEIMSGAKGVGDDPAAWRRWLADRDEAE